MQIIPNSTTTPTPEQLNELRVKCAELLGWKFFLEPSRGYIWWKDDYLGDLEAPQYSRSYDAIMPEIKKLGIMDSIRFIGHLSQISDSFQAHSHVTAFIRSEVWQLCEAFVRLKTEGAER